MIAKKSGTPNLEMSLRLGTITGRKLCYDLENQGFELRENSYDMMHQSSFPVADEDSVINIIVLSVADLSFRKGATYDKICSRAIRRGYELCPAEVGPQSLLQNLEDLPNFCFTVAMETIRSFDGTENLFHVVHVNERRWLSSVSYSPDTIFHAKRKFAFVVSVDH